MAAKKASGATKEAAAKPKASTKKAPVKKTAVKKAGGKVAAETAAKSGTPKAAAKKAAPAVKKAAVAAPKKAAPKKAAVKLNDKQLEILKKVHAAGETGYPVGQKVEERTLEALITRKLLKKGAKNKETGKPHYMLTKTGEKHLATPAKEGSSPTPAATS